tara:strand:+ start:503 stop:859 length:357 start_codon:yes stop_codon:yes gene_type:complete
MKRFSELLREEGTSVSSVAGLQGDPPGPRMKSKMLKRKKFNGCEVFVVSSESYSSCISAKMKSERFSKYIGDFEIGNDIREYARLNPSKSIIIEDDVTGAMTYLKIGKNDSIAKLYGR